MKKITSLLLLLLVSVMSGVSAWAQLKYPGELGSANTTGTLADGDYVVFYNVNTQRYVTADANKRVKLLGNGVTGADRNKVFKVHLSDSKYSFESLSFGGNYLPNFPGSAGANLTTTAANFTIETSTTDSEVHWIKGSNGQYLNQGINWSNNDVVGWHQTGDNSDYKIYPVSLIDGINVTFNYKVDGVLFRSVVYSSAPNVAPVAPTIIGVTNGELSNTDPVTAERSVDVTCTLNLPIQTSTVENPVWYGLKMTVYNNLFWNVNADGNPAYADMNNSVPRLESNQKWAFIGDFMHGFKIYNKGTQKYLVTTGDSYGQMATTFGTADEATSYTLFGTSANVSNGFCIKYKDGMFLNAQSNLLKGWYDYDQGSTCAPFHESAIPLNYASAKWANTPEGALGMNLYLKENFEKCMDAYAACKSNALILSNVESLEAINEAFSQSSDVDLDLSSNAYYRIINAVPGFNRTKGLVWNVNGNTVWNTVDKSNVNAVYQIIADNGKYVLKCSNAEKYIQGVKGAMNPNMTDNGHVEFVALGNAQFNVKFGNGTMHAEGHSNGSGSNGNIVDWAGEANSASAWYLVPATDIEVALTTIEDHAYATTCMPFPVSAVNGAKAYTGVLNADADAITLNEATGFAANEGVLLMGDANTEKAVLAIGGEAAKVDGNVLKGTCSAIALTDDNRADYRVLGVNTDDATEVGFFRPSSSVAGIPANRAYLNEALFAGLAENLSINFGGMVEGIANAGVAADQVNAPVYDLTGRRVVKAVKGGVYIQNGKKFIVK